MGLFQAISNEKKELVEFEILLSEIAQQEGITFSEVCAVIAREASDHADEIPWSFHEPFYLYDYNVISGFVKSDSFSKQSINFLKSMAFGVKYEEDMDPAFKGVYCRVDGGNGWFNKFYFKGTEITASFLDSGVKIPPCLEVFIKRAEVRLRAKASLKEKKEKEKQSGKLSVDTLQEEIAKLKQEIKNLSEKAPSMLGAFRYDDPLQIAIQLRNAEWSSYNEDDRKSIPSQEALVAQLKQQYQEMPDAQARAIEKVACPIKRK